LLLNKVLTVEAHLAGSHWGKGWETFTENIIKYIDKQDQSIVYMLWGRQARNTEPFIKSKNALILEAAHPSPLSARNGFFGCKHFSKANTYLTMNGRQPIEW
jgi:uracil-DNA glycosylase